MEGSVVSGLSVASGLPLAILVGALVLFIAIICGRFGKDQQTERAKDCGSATVDDIPRTVSQSTGQRTKGKKNKRDNNRQVQSVFNHPWSLGSLKGHRNAVLDMDFSNNGKYLVSCSEAFNIPTVMMRTCTYGGQNSYLNCNHPRGMYDYTNDGYVERPSERSSTPESSSSSGVSDGSSCDDRASTPEVCNSDDDSSLGSSGSRRSSTDGMSRRQRRNAKRKSVRVQPQVVTEQKLDDAWRSRSSGKTKEDKATLRNRELYKYLMDNYVLEKQDLLKYGFPVPSPGRPGVGYVMSTDRTAKRTEPIVHPTGWVDYSCCRCKRQFSVMPDYYVNHAHGPCVHHWGKLKKKDGYSAKLPYDNQFVYTCCGAVKHKSPGCVISQLHVTLGHTSGHLPGFVTTKPRRRRASDENFGIFGLDCEMLFTTAGLEVAQVTLVDPCFRVVYNTMVKPVRPIVDYNTRFSGITDKKMLKATKTLVDVQNDLLELISEETILVGHGLENDLKALRMIHSNVVDTSIVFVHPHGLPFRHSLKTLVNDVLNKKIQDGAHNSVEDARSSLHLMMARMMQEILNDKVYKVACPIKTRNSF